jgi:hypothetical protein
MKPKLRKLGGNVLLLRLRECDPNPLADNLRKVEGVTQTAMNQVENLVSGQGTIGLPLLEVDAKELALCHWSP